MLADAQHMVIGGSNRKVNLACRDPIAVVTRLHQFEFNAVLGLHGAGHFKVGGSESQIGLVGPQPLWTRLHRRAEPGDAAHRARDPSRQADDCHPRIAVFCESETELKILEGHLARAATSGASSSSSMRASRRSGRRR